MTQKFTAEEVRAQAKICGNQVEHWQRSIPEEMLNAYADTLSKPADSGRVTGSRLFSGDLDVLASLGFPKTAERIRAALAAQGQGEAVAATDAEIAAWAERHDLNFGGSKTDSRDAFEDAESHHLTRPRHAPPASPAGVPDGCIPVPRSLVERWASVDAFNAPVGAAMELKVIAGQMLQHTAMLAAAPSAPQEVE